ncbi:Hypothetical protein PBC10988_4840 [Planctomycetales bacterium 10988]|nr:Hypothetical protein PBC10988_4840 [Planctomycetales bacterium 10988]
MEKSANNPPRPNAAPRQNTTLGHPRPPIIDEPVPPSTPEPDPTPPAPVIEIDPEPKPEPFPESTASANPSGAKKRDNSTKKKANDPPRTNAEPRQNTTLGHPRPPIIDEPVPPSTSEPDPTPPAPVEPATPTIPTTQHSGVLSFLNNWTLRSFVVILVSCMILFVIGQLVALINMFASWPVVLSWVGIFAVALLAIAILLASIHLLYQFFRLRETPNVSLKLLEDLQDREQTRQEAANQSRIARDKIRTFLQDYSTEEENFQQAEVLGFDAETFRSLKVRKQELIDDPRYEDSKRWLMKVDEEFLAILDGVAEKRIWLYAKQAGVKTAIAPTGFVDSAIILINSYAMIGDLCSLYRVRTNRWSTIYLMGHLFVNTFAASKLEEVTDFYGEEFAEILNSSIGSVLAGLTGKISARSAEGLANGLLLRRLGYATIRHLRPITFS